MVFNIWDSICQCYSSIISAVKKIYASKKEKKKKKGERIN